MKKNEIRKLICSRKLAMLFFGVFKKNPSFPRVVILIIWIWNKASEAQENYNITTYSDHKGFYYESHGIIKTSHTKWDLVTYVDIRILTTNYDKLMTQYNETGTICKQMIANSCNAEIENICNQFIHQFSTTTRPYLYEIQLNRRNAMLSIEHNSNKEIRNRRGLGGTFKRLINVLYGAYSKIDTEFIFKQILELTKNKIQNINLVKAKTRVVQAEILDANHTLPEVTEHHQQLESNLRYLQGLTKESIVNINKVDFKNKLLEQAFLFEVTLNQYAYETQNLIAIINAALDGKIHTSVITPRKLIQELKEIKINLPMGNSFPIEIIPESLPDLFKISETTIFVQDEYLIFSIEIPLITNKIFNVYRLISLPIIYSTNAVILIEPEVEYLVINIDNEEFFTMTEKQWEACVNLGTYKLCKGGQIFHRRSRSNLCEVALLAYQTIPETCKIKFVTLTTPIWDKLMNSNAWLFYAQSTLVTIKCAEPPQIVTVEISGVGRLTTSQDCEIHTDHSIIFPTSRSNRSIYTDLIPENKKHELLLSESLKNIIPQNLKEISIIHDFNSLSKRLVEISKLQKVTTDPLIIFQMEFHMVLVYILILTVISIASGLAIKFRNRIIRMYSPDLPNTLTLNNN